MNFSIAREGAESIKEISSRTGTDDNLPSIAKRSFFMEGGSGKTNDELPRAGVFEVSVILFGIFNSKRFGFVSDGDFAKIIKRREMAKFSLV